MKKIFIVCFLIVSAFGWSQKTQPKKPAASEWDELDKAFVALFNALQKDDKPAFMALSLQGIDCIGCVREHQSTGDYNFVAAEVFYNTIAPSFIKSPVYKALTTRGYTFGTITLNDYKPVTMPKDSPKDLKIYEVWVPTYLANELSKGHPGSSTGFQFVKIKGKFKFYGLTSIP